MRRAFVRFALVAVCCVAIGSLTTVADPSSRASASTAERVVPVSTADYVNTPAGSFHRSCVHAVADGHVAHETSCAYPTHFSAPAAAASQPVAGEAAPAPEPSPIHTGWMVAGTAWASKPVRYLHADFWVPRDPYVKNGQTLFLFPGLQDATGSAIFQPVLQWGVSGAGGGNYWAIASWVVTNTGAWHSTLKRVYPGDHLYGSIFARNCSSNVCDWTVWTNDVTRGWSTTLKIRSGWQLKWVVGEALEVYRFETCSMLPTSYSIAKNIFLSDASGTRLRPQFGMSRWTNACWVYASVNSIDSWVALHYNGL